MNGRRLDILFKDIPFLERRGKENPEITSVVYDSGQAESGCLFFALEGTRVDGHAYVEAALDAGAAAVVHQNPLPHYRPEISYLKVENTRKTLSPVSAAFWDHPSREMTVIGVTGTDGKSSTVSFIQQLMQFEGVDCGALSTISFNVGGRKGKNTLRQSTPEAPQIHGLLWAMHNAGRNHAVIEATSHGLSPRNSRLADVNFDVAVFTNVTREHLEFHGSLEQYRKDKTLLFENIAASTNPDAFGVVNIDDEWGNLFIQAAGKKPVFTFSLKNPESDLYARNFKIDRSGTDFTLVSPMSSVKTRINLPGLFNVENVLAALLTVSELLDLDPVELGASLPALQGETGRMEYVRGNMPFSVLVDYAHSPGSFRKLLPFLKETVEGRIILVFGSAGERDVEKRPEQGAVAAENADLMILTDEDPRNEDPMTILENIAAGARRSKDENRILIIPDRREALRKAFKEARKGDLVAALGKGHEESIVYAKGPLPWNEIEACRELLQDLGWELET